MYQALYHIQLWVFFLFVSFFLCLFLLFRAAPVAYGGSQAKGPIRATANGLHHSYSNRGPEPHLRPTPQLTAMLDPQSTERGQGLNPQTHSSQSDLCLLCHNGNCFEDKIKQAFQFSWKSLNSKRERVYSVIYTNNKIVTNKTSTKKKNSLYGDSLPQLSLGYEGGSSGGK